MLLSLLCIVSAAAQDAQPELTMTDILKLPGKVIGESDAPRPAGQLKVRNYRVEEVALPQLMTVKVGERRVEVKTAFRVIVTGGPFPVRALPPVIWIDDTAVGYGVESENLDEITAVTFDRSLLREGATLYLSYGDKQNKENRTALPEKLKLDDSKKVNK
jgi:hypothetical protein